MRISTQPLTAEVFDRIALLPENSERHLEFIAGEIIEMVSNSYSSEIAATILAEIKMFAKTGDLGRVTGADGGYRISGERYIPDVAFISKVKQPEPSHEAYNPNPPDLAVEVLSPTDEPSTIRIKIVNYLRAGTTVWLVDPERQEIEVYIPDQAPITLGLEDTLEGGGLLSGLALAVKDMFAV